MPSNYLSFFCLRWRERFRGNANSSAIVETATALTTGTGNDGVYVGTSWTPSVDADIILSSVVVVFGSDSKRCNPNLYRRLAMAAQQNPGGALR